MTESATFDIASQLKPESLRTILANVEKEIGSLSGSVAAARTRQGQLSSERSSLILLARSKKDESALARVAAIDEELGQLSRDISDDESALALLREQLGSLRSQIAHAEWEGDRDRLLKQFEASLKGNPVRKLKAAIEEVRNQFLRVNQETTELAEAVIRFDARLLGECNELIRFKRGLTAFLEAMIFETAPEAFASNSRTRKAVLATDWDARRGDLIEGVAREIKDLDMPS